MLRNNWMLLSLFFWACTGTPEVATSPEPASPPVAIEEPAPPPPPKKTINAPWFNGLNDETALEKVSFQSIENPGIILLIIDTLRADALGVYGQKQPTSPFLDQLARNGVVYTNHVSNSTWTRTSVASLLTGAYPNQHGVLELNRGLKRKHVTVAERFKEAGFETATVLANPIVGARYGLTQGYDFAAEPKTHFDDKHPNGTQVLNVAKKWLQKKKDKPFFLSLLLFDPHHPYTPAKALKEQFCPDCDRNPIVHPQREYRGKLPTEKQIMDMLALYHAEVRETDAALARFFGWLDASGLSERVTVAVVADHGEAFGEHDVFEHAFHPWDEVARTPMILSGAAIRSRGFLDVPTHHVDVMPTLMRLGGQSIPQDAVGLPLVQTGTEKGLSPNRTTVSEVEMYGIHRLTVRHNGLKLVRHEPLNEERFLQYYDTLEVYPSVARKTGRWELFNTYTDPGEHTNLAGRDIETHPLAKALEEYRSNRLPQELTTEAPDEGLLEDLKALGYIE